MHEQAVLATLAGLREQLASGDITRKGEFVIVVAGTDDAGEGTLDTDRLLAELKGKLPDKEAARIVSNITGEKRNALYKRLLDM